MDEYRHEARPQEAALLQRDRYTFNVLIRILQKPCDRVITDHRRFLMCYSCAPYPVWVWTPEDASPEELARAYRNVTQAFAPEQGFCYNVRHELAEVMMREAEKDRIHLRKKKNMFAYCCPEPVAPRKKASGEMRLALEADFQEIVGFHEAFYAECGLETPSREQILSNVRDLLEERRLFVWTDNGKAVATCYVRIDGETACFSGVYTRPEARRRGYAASLIYGVTKALRAQGWMPALYTDADYEASNACYAQIGYRLQGGICCVTMQRESAASLSGD